MFLKTKDHTGREMALNLDHIIVAQPASQKGITKLILVGGMAIDIMFEFDNFITPPKGEAVHAAQ